MFAAGDCAHAQLVALGFVQLCEVSISTALDRRYHAHIEFDKPSKRREISNPFIYTQATGQCVNCAVTLVP